MKEVSRNKFLRISGGIDRAIVKLSLAISWVYAFLIVVILAQVILRKGFSSGLIVLEELQWHFYAVGVMFGMAYAQVENAHVRVDLFYSNFKNRTKYIIEVLGMLFLLMPFLCVIFFHSLDFVWDSWRTNEHSAAPAGLPYRWIIKSMIPISVFVLAVACLNKVFHTIVLFIEGCKIRSA